MMKHTMMIFCAFVMGLAMTPFCAALDLAMPAYRSQTHNLAVLLQWQDQVTDMGITVGRTDTIELQEVSTTLLNRRLDNLVIEIPPQYYHRAIDAGWRPTHRLTHPVAMALFSRDDRAFPKTISTPPVSTIAHWAAQQMELVNLRPAINHAECLRQMVSKQVDGCVTAAGFAQQYAQRFELAIHQHGPAVIVPPSLMLAGQGVKPEVLSALRQIRFDFPTLNASFGPFVQGTDSLLYDVLKP